MLHVASVCTPFCTLLRVVVSYCAKFETGQTFSHLQTGATSPNFIGQQFWELLRPFARSLSNRDGDVNENGKTTTLHVHQAFLYISLSLLHVLSRFMEDVNKRRRILLSLFKIYVRTHVKIMRHWKSTLMLTWKRLETGDISQRYHWFPHEMTSEERAQKFHTYDV